MHAALGRKHAQSMIHVSGCACIVVHYLRSVSRSGCVHVCRSHEMQLRLSRGCGDHRPQQSFRALFRALALLRSSFAWPAHISSPRHSITASVRPGLLPLQRDSQQLWLCDSGGLPLRTRSACLTDQRIQWRKPWLSLQETRRCRVRLRLRGELCQPSAIRWSRVHAAVCFSLHWALVHAELRSSHRCGSARALNRASGPAARTRLEMSSRTGGLLMPYCGLCCEHRGGELPSEIATLLPLDFVVERTLGYSQYSSHAGCPPVPSVVLAAPFADYCRTQQFRASLHAHSRAHSPVCQELLLRRIAMPRRNGVWDMAVCHRECVYTVLVRAQTSSTRRTAR
jgi:hypothetical protein